MKKNFTEIEEIIENRITVLEKEYDLDRWDIQEIRTEAYRENKTDGAATPSPWMRKQRRNWKKSGTAAAWRSSSPRSA